MATKTELLDIMKHQELADHEKYNLLLTEYKKSNSTNTRNFIIFNRGFSISNFHQLVYDLKKEFNISDVEYHMHEMPELEEHCTSCGPFHKEAAAEAENSSSDNISESNTEDEAESEPLKMREEYPFLNEENTPDEFKILVSDKIAAYHRLVKNREALQSPDLTQDERAIYAQNVAKDDELNDLIKQELDHFQAKGAVLGKHPIFAEYNLKKKIDKMTGPKKATRLNSIDSQIRREENALAKATKKADKTKHQKKIKDLQTEKALIEKSLS